MNTPIRGTQILNFLEVDIPRNEGHPVMSCRCGDPDIVFGEGPALLFQALLQPSIFAGNINAAHDNCPAGCESFHAIQVFGRTAGFRSPEEQLAECDSRNEDFRRQIQIG